MSRKILIKNNPIGNIKKKVEEESVSKIQKKDKFLI